MRVIMVPQSPPWVTVHANLPVSIWRGNCCGVRGKSTIFVVSKLEHEFVTRFSILRQAKPFLLGAGGKTEVGKGEGDDVEGWGILAACGQERKDFDDFKEAAGP